MGRGQEGRGLARQYSVVCLRLVQDISLEVYSSHTHLQIWGAESHPSARVSLVRPEVDLEGELVGPDVCRHAAVLAPVDVSLRSGLALVSGSLSGFLRILACEYREQASG